MIRAVKGTHDILPPESAVWNRVESTAREIFDLYGFSEIRTPVFERTELFARGVGEDTHGLVAERLPGRSFGNAGAFSGKAWH